MRSRPPGVIELLAGAVGYALRACAPIVPAQMALPTPCTEWDLGALLAHLSDSMADLEIAIRTGRLDMRRPPGLAGDDPVEELRDRAAELLCSVYGSGGYDSAGYDSAGLERFVVVGGVPMPAGLVACTGAVEIAVHGWDVREARGAGQPIPAELATRMLGLCPLLVAGREGLFGCPVPVLAGASPSDQLVGYLGRTRNTASTSLVTDE